MEYLALILGAAIGVAVALFCVMCYRQGLNDGLALKDKKPLPPARKPKAAKAEASKEEKKLRTGLVQFLGYNGDKT